MGFVSRQYDEFVWEYKYRPSKVKDIILPKRLMRQFQGMVDSGNIPNMVLCGPRGCGKTTVCFCVADEIDCDAKYINMSKDRKIDNIRDIMSGFVSSMSMDGGKKMIIGDEVDRLTPEAFDSLKGDMDRFGNNCVFVFTSNNKYKFADHPVMSRLQEIDFQFTKDESVEMKKRFYSVMMGILDKEGIEFNKKAVGHMVNFLFPDMRKTLTEVQKLTQQFGSLSPEAVQSYMAVADMKLFYAAMRDGDFVFVRERVGDARMDPVQFYTTLFKSIETEVTTESLPAALKIIDEYQFRTAFSADKEIPLTVCCSRLMTECEWRKE